MQPMEDDKNSVLEVLPLPARSSREDVKEDGSEDFNRERGYWASEIEYLLSMIGFSVSLGNFWRFPYICSRNGGGAFLIPFLVCLVLCGLPLYFLEVAIGQFSGRSPVHVWALCPLMKGVGVGVVVASSVAQIYFTVICAWSLYYTIHSCRDVLPWTSCDNTWNTDSCVTSVRELKQNHSSVNQSSVDTVLSYQTNSSSSPVQWRNQSLSHTAAEEFWHYNALDMSSGLGDLGYIWWELALCLLASWLVIFMCMFKGVKSVGKAVYITATLQYVILTVMLVRGLTLPGGTTGALYFIKPNFSKILNVQVWIEACLQVFYSLGPVWGGLITLSSYNKFHTNCLRNSIICTFVGEGTSLFAGLVVFSILGFMAHEAGVPITDVVSSGPGLGFVIYPEALALLPLPQLWSFIFFLMLIFLALDTLYSQIEAILSAFLDEFPHFMRWRVPVTAVYCIISYLLGLVFTTQGGMYVFQLVDWYIAAVFPIVTGVLECITLGWIYGIKRFSDDIEMMIGKRAPVFFKVTWCYISPAMLMITFIVTLSQYQPPTYGTYVYPGYATIIGWCIAFLPVSPMILMTCVAIYKRKGPLLQRIKQSLEPEKCWGPSKASYREVYQEQRHAGFSMKAMCIASVSTRP